jgi:hypothetical protein
MTGRGETCMYAWGENRCVSFTHDYQTDEKVTTYFGYKGVDKPC